MIRKHLCLAACALCLYACGRNSGRTAQEARENTPAANAADDGHNAENALDYTGTYEGTIPAADCPGINVSVELQCMIFGKSNKGQNEKRAKQVQI